MNRLTHFNLFHVFLMNGAPKGYVPHYFAIEKIGKVKEAIKNGNNKKE